MPMRVSHVIFEQINWISQQAKGVSQSANRATWRAHYTKPAAKNHMDLWRLPNVCTTLVVALTKAHQTATDTPNKVDLHLLNGVVWMVTV